MERLTTGTPDGTQENIERIAAMFPQVLTEVENEDGELEQAIDFDALRELLGDVAEGQRERYQFTWPGKQEAKAEARRPIDKTMRPEPERSVDWDTTKNLYIEGDNLDALKLLKETYTGKIKLIYIDPPYNTGHDFVYDDDFSRSRQEYDADNGEYDEEGGRLVSNTEGNGRFHSDWCSMMYPRLQLARELLSRDGAIFISIDDNEEQNLLKIGNEIFGSSNFAGKLYVQVNPRGRNLDRYIAKTIEPVLIWLKDHSCGTSLNLIPKSDRMLSEYNRKDSKGLYRAIGLRNRNQSFNPQTRPNLYFPLWINPHDGTVATEKDELHTVMRLPLASDGAPTCWTWSKDKINSENDYIFAEPSGDEWRVYRKDYLSEGTAAFTMVKSLQDDSEFNNDYGKRRIKQLFGANVMSFPKSPALMERILEVGSLKDSIIMDFFSGSATMADSVMKVNERDGGHRKYIMVQIKEDIDPITDSDGNKYASITEIGEERIRRAGRKIRDEVDELNLQPGLDGSLKSVPDVGFRVLRVDSSNFKDTRLTPGETSRDVLFGMADNVKPGRSGMDLLFEVLPRFRIPYSAKIEVREINGRECFVVNDDQLVACFDANVDADTIEAIARMEPSYAVMSDASLADDATASNFEELFRTYSPDTVRCVI